MAYIIKSTELLPERRGTAGVVSKYQDQNEQILRATRRGRKLIRISKRRSLVWLLSIAVVFSIYLAYFGSEVHFKGTNLYPEHGKEQLRTTKSLERPTTKPHRQRFNPCEVSFLDSVTCLLEPMENMKFSNFSLKYVEREDKNPLNDAIGARFGGHQTLEEREKSYYARNQTIHCGFVSGLGEFPNTGFDLDEKDKKYTSTCSVAVSSCIFGSSDLLRRPTSKLISDYSKKNVCFVMFVDEQTLAKLSAEGNVPDEKGNIGLWRIVVVKNLPYEDMRKTGKVFYLA